MLSNVPGDIAVPANGIKQTHLEELPADEALSTPSMIGEHLST